MATEGVQEPCGQLPRGGWACVPKTCDRAACPMHLLWALYKPGK